MIEEQPLFWLLLNILSLIVLSFYSMMEMACISFNQVRLQYYINKGYKKAEKLAYLIQHPARLFGTSLIGVNVAMMFGSEFSRKFHISLGLSPDLAPLTQVMIVIIFGELAPMFAARKYPESTAWLGAPLLYLSAKVMAPLLWCVETTTQFFQRLLGGKKEEIPFFLNQEEIRRILEERDEDRAQEDLNHIVSNIFEMRLKKANTLMIPIEKVQKVPSNCTVKHMRQILKIHPYHYLLIYHGKVTNIVGIALPRELLKLSDNTRLRSEAKVPWFISQNSEILSILKQFRQNHQSLAVVLDEQGQAVGILTLDDIINELIGKKTPLLAWQLKENDVPGTLIEKTFPGNMEIEEFNRQYDAELPLEEADSLGDLLIKHLGHLPEVGESIYLPPYEIEAKEVSFSEVKSVTIKTRYS